jgi:hypothetical protein
VVLLPSANPLLLGVAQRDCRARSGYLRGVISRQHQSPQNIGDGTEQDYRLGGTASHYLILGDHHALRQEGDGLSVDVSLLLFDCVR